MKHIVRGAFTFFIVTLLVLIVLDMGSNGVIKTETATLANNATYEAIKVKANGAYSIDSMDELVAEAIKDIVMSKQADSEIKVQVLGIDAEEGMIDLNVIQTVKHLNGKESVTEQRRTVILE